MKDKDDLENSVEEKTQLIHEVRPQYVLSTCVNTQLCTSLEQQKDDSERCERDNIVKALQCDELHEQLAAQAVVIGEHVEKIAVMHDDMTELRQLITQVGSHNGPTGAVCVR